MAPPRVRWWERPEKKRKNFWLGFPPFWHFLVIIISNLPSQPLLLGFCHHTRPSKSHAQEMVGNTTSKENSNSIFGPTFLNLWIWSFIKILSFDKILEFIPIPTPLTHTHTHTGPEILKICTWLKDSDQYNFSKKRKWTTLWPGSQDLSPTWLEHREMAAALQHKAGRRSEGSWFQVTCMFSKFGFLLYYYGKGQ